MGALRSPSMRVLFAAALLVSASANLSAAKLALVPGDPAPKMRGVKHDKSGYAVEYSAGAVTVINFWASWCEPCKEEMPALQKLWEKHGERGLQIVGVFLDSASDETMRKYSERLGVTYPVIRPVKGTATSWGGGAVLSGA